MPTRPEQVIAAIIKGINTSDTIAQFLGVKRSTISPLLSNMASDGLIKRLPDKPDGRHGRPFSRWKVPA